MKKKSKLLISAASLSLLTVLSVPTILTSCSNNNNSTIKEYSMSFQTNSTYSLGDNNLLPSNVDNEWIKDKVIENKSSIFSIINEPADFDWNSNLSISDVNASNSNGELSFKCSLNKSDQNSQTIDKTITFTGFKTQQVNNNYSIVFKETTSSYALGDSTTLPSSIDSQWIKNKIIDNKNSIFSISNEPANFDWNNNLSIGSINPNNSNGQLSFNCTLKKSNQDSKTINKTITFTGFKTQQVNNYYSIAFNNTPSYAFGDNATLPSNVNSNWIKTKVIQNKNLIFSINNAPADFDWSNNLSIIIVSTDDSNGQLSFNVTLNRATDNPDNIPTISKQLTFTGFLTNTSTSDNGILSPVNPDNIPSDIPPKAPETAEEKRWGNVLLPKIDDSQITMDHLVQMLDEHMGNTNYVKVTFGERKISSKLMADAFAKWITTRWKYFPYFGFSNPVFRINIKDENGNKITWKLIKDFNKPEYIDKTYYVDYLSTNKDEIFDYYAQKWLIPGYSKNTFIEFVNDFLNLISYDMDGIDKVMTAYFYVANILRYKDSPSIETTIKDHIGVCADYSSLMALLLNMVGVPTLPMVTSHHKINYTALHQIVWVYINDLYDGTTKKWYALDPTFAYSSGGSYGKPISFWPTNLNIDNVIFNFNSDPYKIYPTDPHYNSCLFFNAPWKTLYDNNMVETRPIPSNLVSPEYTLKSNPVYYNGYWYYYCYDDNYTGANHNKLVRSKFITEKNNYEVVIDFSNPKNPDPNHLGFNVSEDICNLFKHFSQYNFRYHAFGYNEKIVLCTNVKPDPNNNSVKFLIIDLNTKQCKLINQTVDIRSSSLKDFNFYIKDGEIYYTNNPYGPEQQTSWYKKTYAKLTLTTDEYNFLNSSSDSRSKLFRKLVSYRTIAGTYLIGTDSVNNVSEQSKRNFMQYLYDLEQQLNNNQITDFDAKMKELDSKFNSFIPPITSQGIIKTNELCDVYQYEKSYVDTIDSLPMNKLILMDNLSDFNANDNNTEFDIYYSKTKEGPYTKVRDGLSVEGTGINVRLSDIGQTSYNGYYYFEYYPYGLYSDRKKSKTFEIQVVERKTLPDYEGLYSQSLRNTNYYVDSPNWYNNQIALSFKLNGMSNIQNPIDLKLKYINFDTKEISTLDTKTINGGTSSSVEIKWALDRPSQKNHGIYYVEYTTSANNNSYKFFSNFYFHFTKNDVDNFNVSEWSSLSNLIN